MFRGTGIEIPETCPIRTRMALFVTQLLFGCRRRNHDWRGNENEHVLKEAEAFWGLLKRKSFVELHRISFFIFPRWFPEVMFVSWSEGPPHADSTHEAGAFLIPRHVTWGWEPRTTMGASSRTKHSEWGDTVLLVPPHLAPHQVGVCLLGGPGPPLEGKAAQSFYSLHLKSTRTADLL